ncbi:MAG TPA: carboxypeptidase-like regulatory domain-containing protein, partial [Vicinamibacterales bacterium]|nr:carboxypeptidase-like regulatory domain-containing protein [Vicinamibacterales bacterium]
MIYPRPPGLLFTLAGVLVLVCASAALAHTIWSGHLSGSVTDEHGTPLTGVHITLSGGGADRVADSDAAGAFVFSDLPDGDYDLAADLRGFAPEHRHVRIDAGNAVALRLMLRPALAQEAMVTATKSGERDVRTVPMAVTAVSSSVL